MAGGTDEVGGPASRGRPAGGAAGAGPRGGTLGEFLGELRRRRVFRALAGYGIFSFAVLQVVEPVLHAYDLPAWVLTAVVSALAAGFPIAVVLAWIYDLTSKGVRRTAAAEGAGATGSHGGRVALLLVALGLLAALPGIAFYAWTGMTSRRAAPAAPPAASIAVLPFADMSAGRDQEYLADGIAEQILVTLANVPGLRVTGRTSSFWFKGKGARIEEIGRDLRVRSILEGSVRKEGNRIRVTAQLVNAGDGVHLWSASFDRELSDVFAIQDEIARAVAAALEVKLGEGGPASEAGRPARIEAYEQYLLGRDWQRRGESEENARNALQAFEKAVALDPRWAPGWAGLSHALSSMVDAAPTPRQAAEVRERVLAAAERAITLDPGLPDGYLARASARQGFAFDFAGARADVDRALALNDGDPSARRMRGTLLLQTGQAREALAELQRAAEIDPLSPATWDQLGFARGTLGDQDEARKAFLRAAELAPADSWACMSLGTGLLRQGRAAEALEVMQRAPDEFWRVMGEALARHALGQEAAANAALETLKSRFGHSGAYQIAQVHAWRGEREAALDWLERSWRQHDGGLVQVKYDAMLAPVRADPRFQALLARMKLPPD